jgi:hypothetical protein
LLPFVAGSRQRFAKLLEAWMKRKRVILAVLLFIVGSVGIGLTITGAQESEACQQPKVASLAEQTGASCQEILDLHEAGVGYGQITHAHYLASADLGISFDEAIAMMQDGMGWGEIRSELGLEEGPPPWAGQGGKHGNGQGNGQGNGNKGTNGPPPWAGQGDGDD